LSPTVRARVSISGALVIRPSWSRNHCTSEPVIAIEPSRAYWAGSPASWYATVLSSPWVERTSSVPVLSSRKLPVPYVHLASPGAKQVCPNRAAC